MPPPSPLAIATAATNRLVKEERSYHTELAQQKARLGKIEPESANAEYQTRQEKKAIEETETVIEEMSLTIRVSVKRLEEALEGPGLDATEVEKAKEAISNGKAAIA